VRVLLAAGRWPLAAGRCTLHSCMSHHAITDHAGHALPFCCLSSFPHSHASPISPTPDFPMFHPLERFHKRNPSQTRSGVALCVSFPAGFPALAIAVAFLPLASPRRPQGINPPYYTFIRAAGTRPDSAVQKKDSTPFSAFQDPSAAILYSLLQLRSILSASFQRGRPCHFIPGLPTLDLLFISSAHSASTTRIPAHPFPDLHIPQGTSVSLTHTEAKLINHIHARHFYFRLTRCTVSVRRSVNPSTRFRPR
jgi:hypothetical protein